MCIEDVRLGRKSFGRVIPITAGVAAGQVLGQASNRFSLTLGAPLAGTITYSTDPNVVSGSGINITAGQVAVLLTIKDTGGVITLAWFAIGDAAGRVGAVIESVLPDQ